MGSVLNTFDLTTFDATMILVGAVLFVIFWKVASRVLFVPYLALLEARENATSGAEASAQAKRQRAAELTQQYESKILSARIEAIKKKLSVLNNAKNEARKILDGAEERAQNQILQARGELESFAQSLKGGLSRDIDSMADEVVKKVRAPLPPPEKARV